MKKQLSIYFHPYVFWDRRVSGVGRYVCDLAAALKELGAEVHIPIRDTPTENLLFSPLYEEMAAETPAAPWYMKALCSLISKTPKAHLAYKIMRRWEARASMKSRSYDIIHPTHNNALSILKYRKNTPMVVTVHDMIHELFPESFSPKDVSSQRKRIMVEQADRVIAISHQTKQDLVRLFGTDPDKIDVVHHGNSLLLPDDHEKDHMELPESYILYVGHRTQYKNFAQLLLAFERLRRDHPTMHLICTGGGSFDEAEQIQLAQFNLAECVSQRWVSDRELAILYNRSTLFIYPSLYEGFGLPILEAFACNTPVACARASCFPEVAGEAVRYFDPHDHLDMYQAMSDICKDHSYANDLRERGKERLRAFSWEKSARETLACYQRVLKNNHDC